jgi:hypothetical protein
MQTPELPVVLSLYTQVAPDELFRVLQQNLGMTVHDGIYTPRVVLWMMMLQRLDSRGTLGRVVEQLVQGKLDVLLSRCKRVRQKEISPATGGYSQARKKLPLSLLERSMEQILQRLRVHVSEPSPLLDRRVYVVDGSSVQLQARSELEQAYPPAENQHGKSHWPVMRIVVLHDLETGLAERPCWGPMHGSQAVSEQSLAEQAMEPLPPKSVIVADRNFGIYSIAYGAQQRGHTVVLRLTDVRAKRLFGGPIRRECDCAVRWQPSRFDQVQLPPDTAEAGVAGRLIARRVGRGKSKKWLYLFTTLEIAADEVVAQYGRRWNVETDLRYLKQTVRLQRLTGQSADLIEKELLAAVLAYNLVRAIMCLAARGKGIAARDLSFTSAYNIVSDGLASVLATQNEAEQLQRLEKILDLVGRCRLPRRTKRRSYPRAVWGRGYRYAVRRRSKTK